MKTPKKRTKAGTEDVIKNVITYVYCISYKIFNEAKFVFGNTSLLLWIRKLINLKIFEYF